MSSSSNHRIITRTVRPSVLPRITAGPGNEAFLEIDYCRIVELVRQELLPLGYICQPPNDELGTTTVTVLGYRVTAAVTAP